MDEVKRDYVSHRRRELAAATRGRVITAAQGLLLERGYAATTMADIAAAAGVAVQTVYSATGGGKAALAKRVWDVTITGDLDPVPLSGRPQLQALLAEPDPARKLAMYAEISRRVYHRLGTLARVLRAGAAAGDAELQRLIDATDRERLAGTANLATHLDLSGALRPGLTAERAGHRLWALNALEVADGLTLRCGWTLEEYQAWLTESMTCALLRRPPDETSTARRPPR